MDLQRMWSGTRPRHERSQKHSRGGTSPSSSRNPRPLGRGGCQELVSVYGTTFKELVHEEFGDGIMSAIDFKMDLQREPDPQGDRVKITMSGKFLPYKMY